MKIKAPVIVQDQAVVAHKGIRKMTEEIEIEEDFFLDGPVSKRVAVLDFRADGSLIPGVPFTPDGNGSGAYALPAPIDVHSDAFIQVNAFATVHKAITMFEEADTLGRSLTWGFNAPQLLVVPRAGEWENAFYERDSHSLQLFYFDSRRTPGRAVYTSLSHDIVAHETGHAILDAIAPDLYNAISPQSLALHEAVADLTALMMSFRSRELRETVLRQTGGSIVDATAFSRIAEEFGSERAASGQLRPLRDLLNQNIMPQHGGDGWSPHELSEVLTGALYSVMVRMHRDRIAKHPEWSSGLALFAAYEQFKRMVFRALDYLPPGEISFVDYGRAITAADEAFYALAGEERGWIAEEFQRRSIVKRPSDLRTTIGANRAKRLNKILAEIDMETFVHSDWAAYNFARENRDLLGIPPGVALYVRPRLDVTKEYRLSDRRTEKVHECIFKVSWDAEEANPAARGLPYRRQITVGLTLAIDWDKRAVRALLISDSAAGKGAADRSEMLLQLYREGSLQVGEDAVGPDGEPLQSAVVGEVSGGLLRVRKSARLLHIQGRSPE